MRIGDELFQSASNLCLICGMRNVTVRWAGGKFAQDVEVAGQVLRSDEEVEKGGEGTGPTPHELLFAALGSCTAMTLKVYAERKGRSEERRVGKECRSRWSPYQ